LSNTIGDQRFDRRYRNRLTHHFDNALAASPQSPKSGTRLAVSPLNDLESHCSMAG
jgi:hypothetical protein